ncbi:TonB family protein [Sphingomonas sp. AP4-R1]|uniref:TonB family protein n=1 Tax=Sphingomonas sp. AP4-R1 TaxID=2735134 RepID=UPI00149364BD|nr:TonB family protein [Sphingomonas sp. AP4-R1]QJU56669.1 TonB family protein [Sphingomonas sp. AP4-R1]
MVSVLALLLATAAPGSSADAVREPHPVTANTAAARPGRISLHNNDAGVVRVRLSLGPNGVPTSCTVVKSVAPALDQATCEGMMDRARFEPAPEEMRGALVTERSVTWWR